jgi:hypothetical protein
MTSPAQQLTGLREQVVASFGAAGERVLALPLRQLDAALHADTIEPADVGPLLDQLEDLIEGLLRERGWVEEKRGGA